MTSTELSGPCARLACPACAWAFLFLIHRHTYLPSTQGDNMKKTSIRILTLLVAASLGGGAYAQTSTGAAGGVGAGAGASGMTSGSGGSGSGSGSAGVSGN